jgi:hypothetical protein
MAYSKYFVPQIWATKVERTLHDNLVAKKICSREYEGEIKKAGDTVHFNGLSKPTINNYTGTITYETLNDSQVNLIVDQQNYFAFKVGDIQKAQANVDLKGSQAEEAAFGLSEVADDYVMGLYTGAHADNVVTGAAGATIVVTVANVLSNMAKIAQKLKEKNVPEKDMFCVIPPWLQLKLKLAGVKFSINEGLNGTGGMAWTNELGFDVFVTNQVKNDGTIAVPKSHILAGSYNAIVYADQILDTEDIRLESSFDTAVRGLHVYGAKVVRPERLATGYFEYADETTI